MRALVACAFASTAVTAIGAFVLEELRRAGIVRHLEITAPCETAGAPAYGPLQSAVESGLQHGDLVVEQPPEVLQPGMRLHVIVGALSGLGPR